MPISDNKRLYPENFWEIWQFEWNRFFEIETLVKAWLVVDTVPWHRWWSGSCAPHNQDCNPGGTGGLTKGTMKDLFWGSFGQLTGIGVGLYIQEITVRDWDFLHLAAPLAVGNDARFRTGVAWDDSVWQMDVQRKCPSLGRSQKKTRKRGKSSIRRQCV